MSSTVANGLVHKAFCSQASPGDTHSKSFTRPSRSTLVRVGSGPRGDHRLVYHRRRLVQVNKFIGKALVHRSAAAQFPGQRRGASVMAPRAVLAADPASEVSTKLRLDGQSELQITINASNPGLMQINLSVANTSGRLVLHWGIIREGEKDWRLPSRRPNGTQLYKNKALRTPFVTSGPNANLQIEIDEPGIEAMEFLVVDESQNRWFKDNGQNFRLALPRKLKSAAVPPVERNKNVSLPEDLVQIQAYLRWERRGKQNYTPDQEKIEYEAARTELLEEIARGKSIEELRAKLTKPSDNGNEQKGDVQAKVTQQLQTKKHFSGERIQRKNRDLKQFLNKYPIVFGDETRPPPSVKASTHLELFAEAVVEKDGGVVLNKKIYKLDNKEILALATTSLGKTKIYVALDQSGPYILHWALSKKGKEWMAPPPSTAPPNSTFLELACETPFTSKTTEEPHYKVAAVEIEINEKEFRGMPFVIREGQNWIKNNGFDFYVDLSLKTEDTRKVVHDGKGTAKAFLDVIAQSEDDAQRSLMHRFNIAADLMGKAKDHGILGVAGLLVWLRFMSTRQLVWNKNYNVKPREISKAQDRLTDLLQDTYAKLPQYREMLRLIMACVGRGGEGDVGQRIRDEILVIQRNNDCKGGMMEEWHQKLHNNTSPDDVVICQALMDYIKNGFDINVYWNTLKSNGITKERLLSYDRAIHSEPNFRHDQKEGLLRDLGHYMRTLKAVHSGADLESAIATSLGYQSEGQGFMVGVQINPIRGLPSGFPGLLKFVLVHVEDAEVEGLLEGLLEAREELRPLLLQPHERLKDLLFLDIALDSTVRTAIERGYEQLHNASPEKIMYFITLVLENLALSTDDNEDLLYCLKGWNYARDMVRRNDDQWALFAKSCLDRTRLALASKSELYTTVLQPSAEYLGSQLNVEPWAIDIFTEEIIRAGSAASLSGLLNRLDPTLRKVANLGSWQVISPVEVAGYIETVDELITVQDKLYERPTILIAKSVKGEEEIPDGTVAVLTPDMPDVLSHVSVRARNSKVCFATCFDPNILKDLQKNEGKLFRLKPTSADVTYGEIKESELSNGNGSLKDESAPSLSLSKKQFSGRYAISLQDFDGDLVGAKSRNIGLLKGKVPSWLVIPTSVAIPFGVFEKVLSDDSNKEVAKELETLKTRVNEGDFGALPDIRREVLQLRAPSQLVLELKEKMKESGMPWPGDEGERRWEQAWLAIKKVWASKWNERAYFSTKKVKLDHDYLCMAVLVQEIISADYAFVIHTTNPSSGDASEIYAEVVKGLGETLVGAYPGRALSFICKKNDLNSPKVTGYPSKPIGLFIRPSLIFRSDSNGEDLEGYAGAGLYDSVPMDEEDEVVLDYASDPLIVDANFRKTILSAIARAGSVIEELYGSPQDIEGVVKGGKIIVVQTRPQM